MKIAITSQGQDMTSEVDPRFGRAKFLLVVDTDGGAFTAHDNAQNLNAVQGAGVQTAQNISELNVEALVTSNVGPKAFRVLQAANIKVYPGAKGTIKEAVAEYSAGRLARASEANVDGHW